MSDDCPIDACHADPFEILISNGQSVHAVDEQQLVAAARAVLQESGFSSAMISLAIVDDPTIHELNHQFLNHDWPTDVLSFALQDDGSHLEGEVIISADTAAAAAAELGCTPAAEQLLYVIHGMLHLVGFRDKSPADAHQMRLAEAQFLNQFGWDSTFRGGCCDDVSPLSLEEGRGDGASDISFNVPMNPQESHGASPLLNDPTDGAKSA